MGVHPAIDTLSSPRNLIQRCSTLTIFYTDYGLVPITVITDYGTLSAVTRMYMYSVVSREIRFKTEKTCQER